jgi:hypothetical protein
MNVSAWRQALAWSSLVLVSLAGAHMVDVVAASLLPRGPAPAVVSSARQVDDQAARAAGSQPIVVRLTMQDPSTGRDAEFLCQTTRERIPSDAVRIDADTLREVAQSLCDSISLAAPVLSNG